MGLDVKRKTEENESNIRNAIQQREKAMKKRNYVWAVCIFLCSVWMMAATALAATYTLDVQNGQEISWEFNSAARSAQYEDDHTTIIIPPGTYEAYGQLKVWSNTTVKMEGVTIKKTSPESTMLRFGNRGTDWDSANDGAGHPGYSGFSNITFIGGTWDGGGFSQAIMRFGHSTRITIKDAVFRNVKNSHLVEIGACSDVNISGCTFTGYSGNFGGKGNVEALQFDITAGGHFGAYNPEDDETPCKNVSVTDCTFSGLKRGVGSHTGATNIYFSGMHFDRNRFDNISGYAITMMNYVNSTANGNTITNCGAGILCCTIERGYVNFYQALKGAGSTRSSYAKLNDVIEGNNITISTGANGVNYYLDNYGITLLGAKLKKKTGNMPKGDWRISGVTVRKNTITVPVTGHGIIVQGAVKDTITANTITVNARKKGNAKTANAIYLNGACDSITISKNVITNKNRKGAGSGMVGIRVRDASSVKIDKNKITGASADGIRIDRSKKTRITGNRITKCGRYGIAASKAMLSKEKSNKISKCKGRSRSWK